MGLSMEKTDRNIADQKDWLPQEGGIKKGMEILFTLLYYLFTFSLFISILFLKLKSNSEETKEKKG